MEGSRENPIDLSLGSPIPLAESPVSAVKLLTPEKRKMCRY